uniref:EF-hand domain-containing protein n=1 Tax=Florenciella parvula TaxID=236787 RepID=A0A7S2CRV2_9STRA
MADKVREGATKDQEDRKAKEATAEAAAEGEKEEEVFVRDRTIERVKSKLDAMLEKLEADVAKVDEAIGDKMHVLDLDDDGLMSARELEQVLQTMMKVKMTPEEAHVKVADLMEQIDADMDGLVTVEELRSWVRKERARKSVKVHEDILVEDEDGVEHVLVAEVENKDK